MLRISKGKGKAGIFIAALLISLLLLASLLLFVSLLLFISLSLEILTSLEILVDKASDLVAALLILLLV